MSQHGGLFRRFPASNSRCAREFPACVALAALAFLATPASALLVVSQTNLVTNDQSAHPAQITDSNLRNAWGISRSATSPFWVSDNGTGLSTLYAVNPATGVVTKNALEVTIPPTGAANPTGQVAANIAGAFNTDAFLFVSEDGTISGWRAALGTAAEVLQTGDAANVYKGTTLITTGGHSYLLSANFRAGKIDVLKGDPLAPDLAGNFTDPNLPSGYAPFNIQLLGNRIYVTYALQNATKDEDVAGPGQGIVSAFDLQGSFLGRIGSMGALNSPWGLALAPSSFDGFAGALLVGNFGDGRISIFSADPASPGFLGQLFGTDNNPLVIDGLWGLIPGSGAGNGGSAERIYFAAGPDDERNGLFGALAFVAAVPEPGTLALLALALLCVPLSRRTLN